jgi:hypothetical protein
VISFNLLYDFPSEGKYEIGDDTEIQYVPETGPLRKMEKREQRMISQLIITQD